MKYSNIPLAHTLVALCKARGIEQIVISPGSRNAPLILGFAGDPSFECFSIVDERSAGFFALGLSQQSGKPTALVCTSGSALLNYYPAVAEAFYSRIPLVVISADRPPYKIDIGDGQTIRQVGVLEKHIGYQAGLRQDITHATKAIQWGDESYPQDPDELRRRQENIQFENEGQIRLALQIAVQQKLPVHLNAPFEEPLYGTCETPPVLPETPAVEPQPVETPDLGSLVRPWEDADKIMILVGTLPPETLDHPILERLAQDPSILVLTETTSNLHHEAFFPSIDSIMAPLERSDRAGEFFEILRPDLLLTMGGMVVSKKIKQFLRTYPPARHWHADALQAPDTYYRLDRHIKMNAGEFLTSFLPLVSQGDYDYKAPWIALRSCYEEQRTAYLKDLPFSDMTAFDQVLKYIPEGIQVQLANSSTVRYAQLFDMRDGNPVFCNRGTSGIEGSTSTAVGAAVNSRQPVLLISGDLSFLYDTNGLWNQYLPSDFRIIVINNQGGGIFRILPGKVERRTFETYFETVQEGTLAGLCAHYGLRYRKASTAGELSAALEGFFGDAGGPCLLEVITPRKLNDEVLLGYFDFISSALPQKLRLNQI